MRPASLLIPLILLLMAVAAGCQTAAPLAIELPALGSGAATALSVATVDMLVKPSPEQFLTERLNRLTGLITHIHDFSLTTAASLTPGLAVSGGTSQVGVDSRGTRLVALNSPPSNEQHSVLVSVSGTIQGQQFMLSFREQLPQQPLDAVSGKRFLLELLNRSMELLLAR